MKRRFVLVISVLSFYLSGVFAQQISFNPINYKPDKSTTSFLGITQDHLGYIWISSNGSGIYRYDGREFVNYQHSDSISNSVADNWAECILADSDNIIWIGTFGKGLDRFDPATNSFTHFRHDSKNNSSLGNDTVTSLLEDHEQNLWVGNYSGLDMVDRKTGKSTHYQPRANDNTSLSSNRIRLIYEDHQGTIWVACGSPFPGEGTPDDGGLNRFDRATGKFTRYVHDPANPNSLTTNKVKAMFEDSKGNFWVGTTGNGLHIMDRNKGTFTHYYYDSSNVGNLSRPPLGEVSFDHITFINEDLAGGIWIGSLTSGINRYDPVTRKITHYGYVLMNTNEILPVMKDTAAGFADFSTWQALFSGDGTVWITTLLTFNGRGANLYSASLFRKRLPFYPTSKPGANTFYYDSDSILWIGTDGGLIKKNLKLKTEKSFTYDPKNTNGLSGTSVAVIRAEKNGNIWLGTFGGGLDKFDPRSNTFTTYRHNAKLLTSLCNDSIWSMCLDHGNNLWIGTNNGLDKMDFRHNQFTHYKPGSPRSFNIVYCIREDKDNELWVGTGFGLYKIDGITGIISTVLSKASVKSICVDSKNSIWIGADTARSRDQSLYRLDRRNNQFLSFVDPNSRSQLNGVFDIMEDDKRSLWISTTNAIFKINDKRDALRKFGENSGVHRNNFGTGDNFKSGDGLLFFGDGLGYYSFFPDDLKDNTQPLLNFTSFKLNGNEVFPSGDGVLKEPLWKAKVIRLPFDQNSFSIEFVGINFQTQGEIKYLYMLENYDDGWHKYGTERQAFYFGVPPGNYIFHVRAMNEDGGTIEKQIRIIVLPPWWRTWWAYALFTVAFATAVWGFIYYRSQKLRKENRLLEEKVERRTTQLNQSLEELKATQTQLIQSEKMASLGELTAGIAHEIQNPLNFVNNFSEVNMELIAEMKEGISIGNMDEVKALANDIEENEKKIIHHGRRADAIVKGMLQHSRASTGQKEPTDLNALADEYLRLSYHGLRAKDKKMNATMNTDFDPAVGKAHLISQDIGRVLLNLFNNAFYAVTEKKFQRPDGFEPTVWVSTRKQGNKVVIRIRDNGMGVPGKILDKIFQPFFTTKPAGSGTGLGLSLSYDIIKVHGGELKVESQEGEGAEFIIMLPLL